MASEGQQHKDIYSLPFNISVSYQDVLDAIHQARPSDKLVKDKLYISRESQFLAFKPGRVVYAKFPFMLFKYNVEGGQQRYISYSVLGKAVESTAFSEYYVESKWFVVMLRYVYRGLFNGIPYIDDQDSVVSPTEETIQEYKGFFAPFTIARQWLKDTFPDIDIAYMCGHYISLDDYIPVQPRRAEVSNAYKRCECYKIEDKVKKFFGYSTAAYPVIYDNSYLTNLFRDENYELRSDTCLMHSSFACATLKVLAHRLICEMYGDDEDTETRGVQWHACLNILYQVIIRKHTDFLMIVDGYLGDRRPNVDANASHNMLDNIIGPGAGALMQSKGYALKADILDIYKKCMESVENSETRR